jgi:carboxyl-terminal processing protease
MAGFLLLGAGHSIQAQTQQQAISPDSLRKNIVKAVTQKLQKSHFSPKPIDDKFSSEIWDSFLRSLDPNHNIFLEEDIASLKKYRSLLDDEINSSSMAFFDAAWKLYTTRIGEAKTITEKILQQPFSFSGKEMLDMNRKDNPYPATLAEKEKRWHSFLKYSVISNYAELDLSGNATAVDPALEKKAREKVAKWYRRYFLQQLKETAIDDKFSQYVNAITLNMDPHSVYTFPKKQDVLMAQLVARYSGIGMEMGVSDQDIFVKRLYPHGTAYKSGLLKENDRILAVADNTGKLVPTEELEPADVGAMIRGEQGTSVTMVVSQPGAAERKVTIPRASISENPNKAKSAVINHNGKKIGYVYLPLFYLNASNEQLPGCSADIAAELEKLRDQQVDGVVFDLRGNGGGSLTEVVRMGASFMPATTMSLLRGKENVEVYTSPKVEAPLFVGPLVVLVDESSASASEIFAAAIQDHGRGLVIGTSSSFGKGTSQRAQNLGKMGDPQKGTGDISYGNLRITLQKFYRASGATTQLQGVKPDVVLTDRAVLNSIREAELPAALTPDTLALQQAPEKMNTIDYAPLVNKAQQRAASNTALKLLGKNMNRLQQLQKAPVPLDLLSYRAYKKEIKDLEQQIAQGKQLQQTKLDVSASFYTRIRPDLQKKDELEEKLYNTWIENLSKDLFLSEAVLLAQDMINAPKIKH